MSDPASERESRNGLHTLTFGMGCFWTPDALFGSMEGVVRTRVGYAGGTTAEPSYRDMGDHSETVEIDFDPCLLTYDKLLETFWGHHKPVNVNGYKGRQYRSLLLYRGGEQGDLLARIKSRIEQEKGGPLETEISPLEAFHLAETRHQKYYLKRYPDALAKLGELYPRERELTDATLAARLNGVAKGFTSLERIRREIGDWPIDANAQAERIALLRRIRW